MLVNYYVKFHIVYMYVHTVYSKNTLRCKLSNASIYACISLDIYVCKFKMYLLGFLSQKS